MYLEDLKNFIPILQAAAEGKTIQYRCYATCGDWTDFYVGETLHFDMPLEDYRIKPEPKFRPWKPEEVPVGALIRFMTVGNTIVGQYLIIASDFAGIVYSNTESKPVLQKTGLANIMNYEHSLDHGKTWLPCGVMES